MLFLGPPGVGKSFLVQAIGYQAIKQGTSCSTARSSTWSATSSTRKPSADDKVMGKYLKPDLLIVDDMGMKQLPKRSGEYLFEIIMRRYETRSTMMTSNRPLEDWGKLVGDVPSATAILDRFLHHAEIVSITGKSYRLRNQAANGNAPDESSKPEDDSKPAIPPAGSNAPSGVTKRSKNKPNADNGPDSGACQS